MNEIFVVYTEDGDPRNYLAGIFCISRNYGFDEEARKKALFECKNKMGYVPENACALFEHEWNNKYSRNEQYAMLYTYAVQH